MSERQNIFGEVSDLLIPNPRIFFPPSFTCNHRPIGHAEVIETDEGTAIRFRYTDPEDARLMDERIREARETLRKAALSIATEPPEEQPHDA